MRWLVFAFAITAATSVSADDGYYLEEAFGGASYRGELARYDGAPRVKVGFGVRRGAWAVEALASAVVPDLFYIDCYEEECALASRPQAGLTAFGVDARKRWRLLHLRRIGRPGVYERPGLFVALHGGPRWVVGDDALKGYSGVGIGGGAALEGDLWLLGYYIDLGIDVMRLQGSGGAVRGSTPYLMFGAKIGWL